MTRKELRSEDEARLDALDKIEELDKIEGDKYDQFGERMEKHYHPNKSRIKVSRAASYASAGTCLVVVYSLSQVNPSGLAWTISLYAAVAGIPFALAQAMHYEIALLVGRDSYEKWSPLGKITGIGEAASVVTAIGAFIYNLKPAAFWVFVVVGLFGAISFFVQLEYLKEKLYRPKQEGRR